MLFTVFAGYGMPDLVGYYLLTVLACPFSPSQEVNADSIISYVLTPDVTGGWYTTIIGLSLIGLFMVLGTVAVTIVAGTLASALISTLVAALVAQSDAVTLLVVTQLVGVVVGGLAAAWTGAAVALLYIDVRIRTEHLDQALRSAAAAGLGRVNPPVQPGF